jgi:hypothetical protein
LAEDSSNRPSTSERFPQTVSTMDVPQTDDGIQVADLQL